MLGSPEMHYLKRQFYDCPSCSVPHNRPPHTHPIAFLIRKEGILRCDLLFIQQVLTAHQDMVGTVSTYLRLY